VISDLVDTNIPIGLRATADKYGLVRKATAVELSTNTGGGYVTPPDLQDFTKGISYGTHHFIFGNIQTIWGSMYMYRDNGRISGAPWNDGGAAYWGGDYGSPGMLPFTSIISANATPTVLIILQLFPGLTGFTGFGDNANGINQPDGQYVYYHVTGTVNPVPVNNNPAEISLFAVNTTIMESGIPNAIYSFTRTGGNISNSLTVIYSIGGTAANGIDYAAIGTSVTFLANSSVTQVIINPTPDGILELIETVEITLEPGSGYVILTPNPVITTINPA
jgi:hypothetical protein